MDACTYARTNSAEDQPEDVMIANIARTSFPDLYARRLKEIQEDGDKLNAVLPIFYCRLSQARHRQALGFVFFV